MAGIVKAGEINFPYPFFNPPKTIKNKSAFWGVSGLYVKKEYQGKNISKMLIKNATALAFSCGATGVYADFDYKNIASMRVLSKYYDFIGYTDGRKGSKDEATIYTTMYKSFIDDIISGDIEVNLDLDAQKTVDNLNELMDNIGSNTESRVDYCGGYNVIRCFDAPYNFHTTKINMQSHANENKENKSRNNDKTLDK